MQKALLEQQTVQQHGLAELEKGTAHDGPTWVRTLTAVKNVCAPGGR